MGSTSRKLYALLQQFHKESIILCSLLYCYIVLVEGGWLHLLKIFRNNPMLPPSPFASHEPVCTINICHQQENTKPSYITLQIYIIHATVETSNLSTNNPPII